MIPKSVSTPITTHPAFSRPSPRSTLGRPPLDLAITWVSQALWAPFLNALKSISRVFVLTASPLWAPNLLMGKSQLCKGSH